MEFRKLCQNQVAPNKKVEKNGVQERDIYIEIVLLAFTAGGFSVFNVYYWLFEH